MNKCIVFIAFCLSWIATSQASAQESYWSQLEPLVDAKTFAIVRVKHSKPFGSMWSDLAFEQGRPYDSLRYLVSLLQRLTNAGIDDITIILRYESSHDPFMFAFRQSNQLSTEQTRQLCSDFGLPIKVDTFEGWVLISHANSIASVQSGRLRAPLGNWEPALQSGAAADLQFVVAPNADQRRVFAELVPESISESIRISIAGIQALDWASVEISNPTAFDLKVTLSGLDAKGVPALQQAFDSLQQFVSASAETQPNLATIGELLTAIQFTPQDNQLRFESADDPAVASRLTANVQQVRDMLLASAATRTSLRRIQEVAFGMHNYHDAQQSLPQPYIASADGKPLLSWRVAILPYLGEKKLYEAFHLNEPWDSPHNKSLISRMPDYFLDPRSGFQREDGKTNFLIPVSGGAAFEIGEKVTLESISNLDGCSNTLLIFESDDAHAQIWTDPQPFTYDPSNPVKGLFPEKPHVAYCAAMVGPIDPRDPQAVADLFSKNGDAQKESSAEGKQK